MKRILILLTTVISLSSCGLLAGIDWNEAQLVSAAGKAVTAMSLTNEQIISLSQQSVAYMDQENTVDNGAYHKRLSKLLNGVKTENGLALNFKVYITKEINAFACGDGSIRVYSGLMDVMDDSELMAIIGHEIGHVVHQDTKKQMQRAYAVSAAREAIYAAGGVVGGLAGSVIGDLSESYVSAQFSQKQEFAADEYGFKFSTEHGFSPYSMSNALEKLVQLSSGSQASAVAQMFSSHPDSATRAAKMREKADKYTK